MRKKSGKENDIGAITFTKKQKEYLLRVVDAKRDNLKANGLLPFTIFHLRELIAKLPESKSRTEG